MVLTLYVNREIFWILLLRRIVCGDITTLQSKAKILTHTVNKYSLKVK